MATIHTLCIFGADLSRVLDLDGADKDALKRLTDERTVFERGTILRASGDPVRSLYVIQQGWLMCSLPLGTRRQVTRIGLPGDMIGLGEVTAARAIQEIRAVTKVEVSEIHRDAFGAFLNRHPHLGVRVLLLGEREKRRHAEWLRALGRMSAREKLALFLVVIHERLSALGLANDAFAMPLRQQEIGDFTGLSSVSVSKVLGAMQLEKLIRCSYGEIRILDHGRLRALAEPVEKRLDVDTQWLLPDGPAALRSEGR